MRTYVLAGWLGSGSGSGSIVYGYFHGGGGNGEIWGDFWGEGEGVLRGLIWYYDAMILVGVGDVVGSGMERGRGGEVGV